jgi:hypothetical protein
LINITEIIIGFIYCLLFGGLGYFLESKMTSSITKKYFMIGLILKLIGGMSVGLIYYYYYKGGDTVTYYTYGAQHIFDAFKHSPSVAFQMIFGDNTYTAQNFPYVSKIWVYRDSASYYCVRFAGFFNLFAFNTYSGTSILMAFFSYICVWRLYQFLVDLYPDMNKQFAIGFLFMPSVFFWGSGVLKDTITFAFLCLIIRALLTIYYQRKNLLINVLITIISGFFLAEIKIYILIALIPALVFLYGYGPIKAIKNPLIKIGLTPFIAALGVGLGYFAIQKVGESNSKYNLEAMAKTAEVTARWIHHVSVTEGGAGYTLGDYDFGAMGVLKKTIPAIFVSLYRPLLIEAKNPVMLLSAIESSYFMWLLYLSYFKNFSLNSLARSKSIIIPFSLIFVLIFSWAIGLTTYNFGSLVRYKIPMMPFYVVAMTLIQRNKKLILAQRNKT